MPGELEFVDTNILVYAPDRSAGEKRSIASSLLDRLDLDRCVSLSIQVLQEFAFVTDSKSKTPLPIDEIVEIIEDLSDWVVFCPEPGDVIGAMRASREFKLSFWDSMIVHSARQVEAAVLWSEDLNDGQNYGGVVARNPFRPVPAE